MPDKQVSKLSVVAKNNNTILFLLLCCLLVVTKILGNISHGWEHRESFIRLGLQKSKLEYPKSKLPSWFFLSHPMDTLGWNYLQNTLTLEIISYTLCFLQIPVNEMEMNTNPDNRQQLVDENPQGFLPQLNLSFPIMWPSQWNKSLFMIVKDFQGF